MYLSLGFFDDEWLDNTEGQHILGVVLILPSEERWFNPHLVSHHPDVVRCAKTQRHARLGDVGLELKLI